MTVLLWLFKNKENNLPNSSAELYNYFICHTLYRHLKSVGIEVYFNSITDIENLSNPYKIIMQQLASMCLAAISRNQLVFSMDEIKSACPNIDSVPGAINCFGLLQVVDHYSDSALPTKTFNFIHFSIREFLAGYQITCLPPKDELKFIETNFFSEFYTNTFAMYVGLTKGQRRCFKTFLSTCGYTMIDHILSLFSGETKKIGDQFFNDHLKCLWLFQCVYEANDQEPCNFITKKLITKIVVNQHILGFKRTLLPNEVHTIATFFTKSSNKKWCLLNLRWCNMGDEGLGILHQSLVNSDAIIESIELGNNLLTPQSAKRVIEILNSCKTKSVTLLENRLSSGLDLSNNSTLENLNISCNNVSAKGGNNLFMSLIHPVTNKNNCSLRVLDVASNHINDAVIPQIIVFLSESNVLQKLYLNSNEFTDEGKRELVSSIKNNNVLLCLALFSPVSSILPIDFKSLMIPKYATTTEEYVNMKRNDEAKLRIY